MTQQLRDQIYRLREQLSEAKELIQEQQQTLEKYLGEEAVVQRQLGYVLESTPDRNLVMVAGDVLDVSNPKGVVARVGDAVLIRQDTMQIVGVAYGTGGIGSPATVVRVLSPGVSYEVSLGSETRIVKSKLNLKEGDRVLLDVNNAVATGVIPKVESRSRFATDFAPLDWSEIYGQEEAIREVRAAIEDPLKFKKHFARYNKSPLAGLLLIGPPGCGKTSIGRAIATAMSQQNKGSKPTYKPNGFLYLKGPEVLDRWVGSAEEAVRGIFEAAREHKRKHGSSAVIFIDEPDAILASRGTRSASGMEQTIVPTFLTEMNGLGDSGALVILATNRPDILDPAITRDKRIDRKIEVKRPNREAAEALFSGYLKAMPLAKGIRLDTLVRKAASAMYEDAQVVKTTPRGSLLLRDISSGAMVSSIVDRATSIAIYREINTGAEGLTEADLLASIDAVRIENQHVNHALPSA